MIGVVAKMCSYEAMYGNMESYRVHMMGLKSTVHRRGGLEGLGLEGLLGRICVWIDLNAAFCNGTERFFDKRFDDLGGGVVGEIEPNPGQFIGSWEDWGLLILGKTAVIRDASGVRHHEKSGGIDSATWDMRGCQDE